MTALAEVDPYAVLVEPATIRMQRLLPGPAERLWRYLTDSDLRSRWLASGVMAPAVGAPFELVWRNDDLSDAPGARPEGFAEEHRLASRITAFEPNRRLAFTWGDDGEVSFDLEPRGDRVLLTLTHRRIRDRAQMLLVGPGWHAHLDVLADRLAGTAPGPFWDAWLRLRDEYERRIPA